MTPYSVFVDAFLEKTIDYTFLDLDDDIRTKMVIGYMKRTCSQFNKICEFDLLTSDDKTEMFEADIDVIANQDVLDIISEGMVVEWLKPYFYRNENMENALNTKDYSLTASPANITKEIREVYHKAQRDFVNKMREYSYQHADLTQLNM
jgi:cytidylate kinase